MSIEKSGFLSTDIARATLSLREKHKDCFLLAEALSETAQQLMLSANLSGNAPNADSTLLAAMFLARATSTFQGVILMAERGMLVEARTLTRSCFENAACLCAIARLQDDAVPKLVDATQSEKLKLANDLLAKDVLPYMDAEQAEGLRKARDALLAEKPKGYSVHDMAREGNILSLYIFYRQLSFDAAHPSIESLERYYGEPDDTGHRHIKWGPVIANDEIRDTLLHACCFFMASVTASNDLFGGIPIGELLSQHADQYKRLLEDRT